MTITNEDNMVMMARYEDNHFDLAIVDPPYGIDINNQSQGKGGGVAKKIEYTKKDWDKTAPNKDYFTELLRVSKNVIIWGANHFIENIPNQNSSCWIVWDKDNGGTDFADSELAYTTFKTAVRNYKCKWSGMLQYDMKNKEKRIHPTQKPIRLYEWVLDTYATAGDKILDTHLGSGSIAIACHNRNYELTACELDKEYYEAATKRIAQHKQQLTMF
tara:strand:+ start:82 stop:729 length:648 start_codon:yes stop_codon:yes gene_type:complete